ncbi:MAG: hypothetical protein IJ639_08500 [Ruminococcus sp.]|nr:hypothetical protein [Ruminococcus sp.]
MKKQLFAAVLALILLLTIALSITAVVMEASHDCSGVDCQICEILKAIINIVRTASLTAVLILMYLITAAMRRLTKTSDVVLIRFSTPVSEKTRLLN